MAPPQAGRRWRGPPGATRELAPRRGARGETSAARSSGRALTSSPRIARRRREGQRGAGASKRKLGRILRATRRPLGQGGRTSAPAAPARAVRRDGLLEPVGRHRQGRQGPVTFKAPAALSEYRFTARGVTGADTLVGQTTADLAVRKDFFVDLKVPAALTQGDKPRFIGRGASPRASSGTLDLRLTIYAGGREEVYPEDGRASRPTASRRSCSSRSRSPTATGPAHARRDPGRGEGRADGRGADPPLGRAGVRLGLGHDQRRHDGRSSACRRAGAYESPRCWSSISPTAPADAHRAGAGRRRLPARATARRICIPRPPNTTADRAGDLLAARRRSTYLQCDQGDGHARGRPPHRPDPRAGRRADRAPERGRRLALGRRHAGGQAPAERPHHLGRGRLGARDGRAARPADRRRGPRQGGDVAGPGVRQGRAAATTRPAPRSCTP